MYLAVTRVPTSKIIIPFSDWWLHRKWCLKAFEFYFESYRWSGIYFQIRKSVT